MAQCPTRGDKSKIQISLTQYLSEVDNFVENSSKVRSDLNLVWIVEVGEPEVVDSLPAVVRSLADGADYCSEMRGM